MNLKVSVIVPVYNAEFHLHQCIDSILNQTYEHLEVILINDGSTDKSVEICDGYVNQDKRVQVLHIANQGVSNARNKGIEISTGDFITFVDADDWVDNNMISEMMKIIIKEDPDVLMCSFYLTNGNKKQLIPFPWSDNEKFYLSEIRNVVIPSFIFPIEKDVRKPKLNMGSVCRCLFKSEVIKKNRIGFDTKLRYQEDLVFILQVLRKCKEVVTINTPYYYYRQDAKRKISTTQNHISNLYENLHLTKQYIYEILNEDNYDLDFTKQVISRRSVLIVYASICNTCAQNSPYGFLDRFIQSKQFIKKSNFKESFKLLGYNQFAPPMRVLLFFIKHNFISPIILYYSFKNRFR